jgi:hypothetical protein
MKPQYNVVFCVRKSKQELKLNGGRRFWVINCFLFILSNLRRINFYTRNLNITKIQ